MRNQVSSRNLVSKCPRNHHYWLVSLASNPTFFIYQNQLERTMKTFRKLSITLNGYEPEALIKKLETQNAQYWYQNIGKDR